MLLGVPNMESIEASGQTARLGTFDADVISLDPVDGCTSRAWGTLTRHADGKVAVERA